LKRKIYNITVCILCVVSVTFAILDFTKGLTPLQVWIDNIIYWLFVIDYVVRFLIADQKKDFIKGNVFDLIAIIPFNSAFRVFRVLKFTRLLKFSKLTKLFRIGSVSARMMTKVRRFLNTNGFKYVLMLSGASILCATFGMMYFEQMTFTDSLWWSFVTATTVGYGDLSPSTNAGRIIASLLMLVGIGLIGSLTSSITSFFLNTDSEPKKFSSDKVEMVLTMYESLSDEEKNAVKQELLEPTKNR
jgi:voltage-gated potassium channel